MNYAGKVTLIYTENQQYSYELKFVYNDGNNKQIEEKGYIYNIYRESKLIKDWTGTAHFGSSPSPWKGRGKPYPQRNKHKKTNIQAYEQRFQKICHTPPWHEQHGAG